MLRNRILYAVLLLALLLFNLYLNNVYSLLLLLAAVLLPLVSVLFSRLSRDAVSITLSAPELAEEDAPAEERRIRASVGGKSTQRIPFRVEDAEVGKLFATLLDLTAQDLFGLVAYPVRHVASAELLVPPPEVPAEVLMLEALETAGESVRYSEKEKGTDVSELFDIRDYEPGDEIRAIHWKLSAKAETPILREFSQPLNYSVVLLVELAAASAEALQSCVAYAAGISRGLLEAGVLHTMLWFDRGADEFCDYNITNREEQELAELRLTSSCFHEAEDASLVRFLETGRPDPASTLIYLTTSLQSDEVLRATRTMPVRIERVGDSPRNETLSGLPLSTLPESFRDAKTISITV